MLGWLRCEVNHVAVSNWRGFAVSAARVSEADCCHLNESHGADFEIGAGAVRLSGACFWCGGSENG